MSIAHWTRGEMKIIVFIPIHPSLLSLPIHTYCPTYISIFLFIRLSVPIRLSRRVFLLKLLHKCAITPRYNILMVAFSKKNSFTNVVNTILCKYCKHFNIGFFAFNFPY